jgi:hypothetical protein
MFTLLAATAILAAPARARAADAGAGAGNVGTAGDAKAQDDARLYSPDHGPRRTFAVEINPVLPFINHYGVNVEIVPVSHHALVLSPYYSDSTTGGGQPGTGTLPNTFEGFGGELGYRYYFGEDGPRGVFLGASFLLGWQKVTPQNGDSFNFTNFGGALDVGYQALVGDFLVLGIGAGLQYTTVSQELPLQELPASIVANKALRPRLLTSFGFAF